MHVQSCCFDHWTYIVFSSCRCGRRRSCFWKKKLPILSQAGRTRYIVIGINPAFTKMIDGTEKPKVSTKFAKRAARYN